MAIGAGIDVDKVNELKVGLLDYVEQINTISNRLESSRIAFESSMNGSGKDEIISKYNSIAEQIPSVNANINTYIIALGNAVKQYQLQDENMAAKLTRDVSKLDMYR